jgi:hypothetical protein
MEQLHCGMCGGVVGDPARIAYRLPDLAITVAASHGQLCACAIPVHYGPPDGFSSMVSIPSVGHPGRRGGGRGPQRHS